MKIKIISDGTIEGTKVVSAKTGEEIESVTKIGWMAESGEIYSRAIIEIINVPVEIESDAELQINVPINVSGE